VNGVDLRDELRPDTIAQIIAAIDEHAVIVFREQALADEQQLAFVKRLGTPQTSPSRGSRQRLQLPELSDISNLDENQQLFKGDDRRRMRSLGNRLWHIDSSFQKTRGEYSVLSAHAVPSRGGETEYADLRSAYDALPAEMKAQLQGLRAEHSHTHSRAQLGFSGFSKEVEERLPPVEQPVVSVHPGSKRRTLYIGAHACSIVGWPIPEGRILLHDLIEFATQPQFVYRHNWRVGDLVIWDNRCTMHRGRPFDETEVRDLRKVTTLEMKPVLAGS
jgi:alpha-ketoglutarate-dependent 2,4-dichlorophenoxyacetate dioxygenase